MRVSNIDLADAAEHYADLVNSWIDSDEGMLSFEFDSSQLFRDIRSIISCIPPDILRELAREME